MTHSGGILHKFINNYTHLTPLESRKLDNLLQVLNFLQSCTLSTCFLITFHLYYHIGIIHKAIPPLLPFFLPGQPTLLSTLQKNDFFLITLPLLYKTQVQQQQEDLHLSVDHTITALNPRYQV